MSDIESLNLITEPQSNESNQYCETNRLNKSDPYLIFCRLILMLSVAIVDLWYAFNDESCVNITIPRFFMNLKIFLMINGFLELINSVINLYWKCKNISSYFKTMIFIPGLYVFFNVSEKCNDGIYYYLMVYFMVSLIMEKISILVVAESIRKALEK